MRPSGLFIAAAFCSVLVAGDSARTAAPSYSASGVVNSASYAPDALAPYTLVTIFGSDLSLSSSNWSSVDLTASLPVELSGVSVYVGGLAASLIYVSPSQINILMPDPSRLSAGQVTLQIMRQGLMGPSVKITVRDVGPALFCRDTDHAVATHATGSLITRTAPAEPGETVVIYATGLGATELGMSARSLPTMASQIVRLRDLRVLLDGVAVDSSLIHYAGITPKSAGLYQINLTLPENTGINPEVRIAIGDQTSIAGLKLSVRKREDGTN